MMTAQDYERAAQEYLDSLPPEHFMEATTQSIQREITLGSFSLLRRRIEDFQYFSELLVQDELADGTLVQVVPDNMGILSDEPYHKRSSYCVKLEKVKPFWVLEYVSESNKRKDYEDSFRKYEDVLQVPYYLIFDPDKQDLRVHRYNGEGYVLMEPDMHGRVRIDQLDLEVGLLDGWLRFWHKGELLPLTPELEEELDRAKRSLEERDRQIAAQADLLQHKDEILNEQSLTLTERTQELKHKDEQLTQKDKQLTQVAEQLTQKDKQLTQKERQLTRKDKQLIQKDEQIAQIQQRENQVVAMMRQKIAEKAQQAGREDILGQVNATTDTLQLTMWLTELA